MTDGFIEIADLLNNTEEGRKFLESQKKRIEKKFGVALERKGGEVRAKSEVNDGR